jgi:hypothetical protein
MVPGYTETRLSFYEEVLEQRRFIMRASIVPSITPAEHQRLVRILGGAERILEHPMDKVFDEDLQSDSLFGFSQQPSLFSFLRKTLAKTKFDRAADGKNGERAATLEMRKRIGVMVLKHFPRYTYGNYYTIESNDWFADNTAALRKMERGVAELIRRCEAVVDAIQPLGDIASSVMQDPRLEASQRSYYVNTDTFQSKFNDRPAASRRAYY